MESYFFLFGIGCLWLAFAVIQDLKTREIANWLTFSLIAITIVYRAFSAIFLEQWAFLWWGLLGCAVFVGCAYAFYYSKVFAGGDAKLLMGLGIALPYQSGNELVIWGSAFLFFLFFGGALYTLLYSIWLVIPRWRVFRKRFLLELKQQRWLFLVAGIFTLIILLSVAQVSWLVAIGVGMLLAIPFLYAYLQSVERVCMMRLAKPGELREGDWLAKPIHVAGTTIPVSVHGLSLSDIVLLRRERRAVVIKEGVPFVPAFLLAYGLMVFFAVVGGLDSSRLSLLLSFLSRVF